MSFECPFQPKLFSDLMKTGEMNSCFGVKDSLWRNTLSSRERGRAIPQEPSCFLGVSGRVQTSYRARKPLHTQSWLLLSPLQCTKASSGCGSLVLQFPAQLVQADLPPSSISVTEVPLRYQSLWVQGRLQSIAAAGGFTFPEWLG